MRRVIEAARSPEPVNLGFEAWTVPGSETAARLAAGGLLAATERVLRGELDTAFVIARPPGHHAERAASMGFCLFNNMGVAARWAQREHGVERVAIVDWDVHHGNGTEEIFYEDGSVLTISLHQDRLYPAHTRRPWTPAAWPTSTSRCRRSPATWATSTRSSASSSRPCARSRRT